MIGASVVAVVLVAEAAVVVVVTSVVVVLGSEAPGELQAASTNDIDTRRRLALFIDAAERIVGFAKADGQEYAWSAHPGGS